MTESSEACSRNVATHLSFAKLIETDTSPGKQEYTCELWHHF